jgi:hypothetical protein
MQAPPDQRSDTERADVLARLSKAIGIEITRITRSPSDPPVFGIETPYGGGSLGGVEAIVNNRKFRVKIAEMTNRIPRSFKQRTGTRSPRAAQRRRDRRPRRRDHTGRTSRNARLALPREPRRQRVAEMSEKARRPSSRFAWSRSSARTAIHASSRPASGPGSLNTSTTR